MYATDLDGDGDADVLSASQLDNKIAWYENLGLGNDAASTRGALSSGDHIVEFGTRFATYSASGPGRSCGDLAHRQRYADPLDVWYRFQANSDGPASVSTCGTADFNTTLETYSADARSRLRGLATTTSLVASGFTSQIDFHATALTTYYVRVAGFGDGTSQVVRAPRGEPPRCTRMRIAPAPRPIGIGETVFSNVGAGDSGVAMGCVEDGETADVWFSYTAIGDCPVTIDLSGSNYDTAAAVYSGDCGALTQVDCNDDGGGEGVTSFLSFTATAGTTYLIQVGGYER